MKSPSKRPDDPSLVAGMAALAAAAASLPPAIAAGAAGGHPDAELLELGREYQRLEQAIKAADAVVASYNNAVRPPRDVMRHRIGDHLSSFRLPVGPTTRSISIVPEHSALYSEDEIAQLQDWPADRHPDERARVEEILAEWDRWNEECDVLAETMGVNLACDQIEELVPAQRKLAKRIASAPATSLAGLRVRALILVDMFDEEEDEDATTDKLMIWSIVRDLIKMAT